MKRREFFGVLTGSATALALSACGSSRRVSGKVVSRHYFRGQRYYSNHRWHRRPDKYYVYLKTTTDPFLQCQVSGPQWQNIVIGQYVTNIAC